MGVFHLTERVSIITKRTPMTFRYFVGKTNRMALYSLTLLCWEMNLYIVRQWAAQTWEEPPRNSEIMPESTTPSAAPARASIVPFPAAPVTSISSHPPEKSMH